MESSKMVLMKLFAGQQWMHIENSLMDSGLGKKDRVQHMEKVTWKLTLSYVKLIANGNLLYDPRSSNWGSVANKRGGMGKEVGGSFKSEGTYVNLSMIHVDAWQKPTQFCKATFFQLKNIYIFKSRNTTFPANVHIVKALLFPVVMRRYESLNIKKLSAEELILSNCGAEEDS